MKKLLLFTLCAMCSMYLLAQPPLQKSVNGNVSGRIYGKITDSTGTPIADVSIMVLQNKIDSNTKNNKFILLKGMTTTTNGEFDLEDLPTNGKLKLKISAVGFKEFDQVVTFMPGVNPGKKAPPNGGASMPPAGMASAFEKDMGKIIL